MTAVGRWALSRAVVTLLAVVVTFGLLQGPVRTVEVVLLGFVLQAIPAVGDVVVLPPAIMVFPDDGSWIEAVLAPSCSTLAPVLATGVLLGVAPGGAGMRRAWRAVAFATAVIAAGNGTRLLLSLLAGRWLGLVGLIGFHDVVGAAFSYVYVFVGILTGLRQFLPADGPAVDGEAPAHSPAESPARMLEVR